MIQKLRYFVEPHKMYRTTAKKDFEPHKIYKYNYKRLPRKKLVDVKKKKRLVDVRVKM